MVGEHIRARKGGRWNHAIDCGDETVIHLDGDAGRARVRRSYRPEFISGAEVVEVVTHRERTFPPGEIVARAYSRIADPALAAMFRDSEAFAEWCATGRLTAGPANVAVPAPPPVVSVPAAGLEPPAPEAERPRRRRAAPRRAGRPASRAAKARGGAKKRAAAARGKRMPRPVAKAAKRGARRKTRRR